MHKRVEQTIVEYELLSRGDHVLVGLSGGPDSVALLHCLHLIRKTFQLRLSAVYLNHGLRPRAARHEEQFCRELCEKLKVTLLIERVNVRQIAEEARESLELAGRRYRHALFERLAGEHDCNRIALGHHQGDQVETVLHRIIRGTGIDGLSGMPIKRGKVIRPLLLQTRNDILRHLDAFHLDHCLDRSNDRTEFTRNYIRQKLLPMLRSDLNPGVDRALWNLSETAAADSLLLRQLTNKALQRTVRISPGGKIEVALGRFRGYAPSLRWRLLRACMTDYLGMLPAVDRIVVQRCDNLAMKGGKPISLPGGLSAMSCGDHLLLHRKHPVAYEMGLQLGRKNRLPWPKVDFAVRLKNESYGSLSKRRRAHRVQLDSSRVRLPLVVRSIRPGDRFRPLGLAGTKKVSDYLTDRKIAAVYRDEIPVVCDSLGIVWLVGFEIADRTAIDRKTNEVIEIECTRRGNQAEAAR
jgi:tRNA(Ile)-lysidine synthase